jgi:hypothetical protein
MENYFFNSFVSAITVVIIFIIIWFIKQIINERKYL